MVWLETRAVDERLRFVLGVGAGDLSVSALCRRAGVSRKTGYKWLERWRLDGAAGLEDRSRAPLSHPQGLEASIAEACLGVRRAHPTWGPWKVKQALERVRPGTRWPAPSTIGALFDREGLTVKRRLRRRGPVAGAPFAGCTAPGEVWCMDFKGWFRTLDGARCDPFTLADAASRYLIRCQIMERCDGAHVWPVLDAAFREFGLPGRLRSDNGPPFASTGAGGLSRLSVKLIKAGVQPERIAPGKPQQNGRLERLHLTLLKDAASPPAASLRAQARRFADFRRVYNEERPHQALRGACPADVHAASLRAWDGVLREPAYGDEDTIRRVRSNGEIKWRGEKIFLSEALAGEPVALTEGREGWTVRFGQLPLGLIPHGKVLLARPRRKARGLVDKSADLPTTPRAQQPQSP
jgi:transposase InsO family protein